MSSVHENHENPEFAVDAVKRGDVVALDFGSALAMLKSNAAVARLDWNGPGQYLRLQRPTDFSKMSLPYIYITTVRGDLVPWLASQTDLLASDWYVVDSRDTREEKASML